MVRMPPPSCTAYRSMLKTVPIDPRDPIVSVRSAQPSSHVMVGPRDQLVLELAIQHREVGAVPRDLDQQIPITVWVRLSVPQHLCGDHVELDLEPLEIE